MATHRVDWSILRGTLIVFVLALGGSAATISASYYFRRGMEAEYQRNHARFRQASQQYLAVDDEERIIQDFYPDFVRLYRAGRLGAERRLSWLETLRQAGDTIKLPELNYKLDAQRPATPDFTLPLSGYTLLVSPMNLKLGLLHEGDLLTLFRTLDSDALGQYSIRSCNLQRYDNSINVDLHTPNVMAECVLDWWTINLAGGRELKL